MPVKMFRPSEPEPLNKAFPILMTFFLKKSTGKRGWRKSPAKTKKRAKQTTQSLHGRKTYRQRRNERPPPSLFISLHLLSAAVSSCVVQCFFKQNPSGSTRYFRVRMFEAQANIHRAYMLINPSICPFSTA